MQLYETWLPVLKLFKLPGPLNRVGKRHWEVALVSRPQPRVTGQGLKPPPPVLQPVPDRKGAFLMCLKFNYWIFTFFPLLSFFLWKQHQLVKETQTSLDALADYCIVSAFIFHLSTKGYVFDFNQSVEAAFQVSYLCVVHPITRVRRFQWSQTVSSVTRPNQQGFSKKMFLLNQFTFVVSKKKKVRELGIPLMKNRWVKTLFEAILSLRIHVQEASERRLLCHHLRLQTKVG